MNSLGDMFRVAKRARTEHGGDLFTLMDGCYWYLVNYHRGQGSWEYAALSTFPYKPSPLYCGPKCEQSYAVYAALIETRY